MAARRTPQQARSKAMVEAIVDAGFASLGKHGIDGTTTRHIADIAGISPGTLYQYFRDKEAVFQAMGGRFAEDFISWLQDLKPRLVQKEIGELIVLLLHEFRDWLRRDDGRYLEFARHLDRLDLVAHMARVERALIVVASQYGIRHPELLRGSLQDIPAFLYIATNAGASTLIRYLSAPSPYVTFDQLVRGLSAMFRGYVAEISRAGSGSTSS